MKKDAERDRKHDYGPEIIGLMALTALSATSHFWYVLVAACAAIAVVAFIALIGKFVSPSSRSLPLRGRSEWANDSEAS